MNLAEAIDLLEARGLMTRVTMIELDDGHARVVFAPGIATMQHAAAPTKGDLEARAQREHDRVEADMYAASEGWR